MVRKLIMDSYDWFVDIVAERRKMPRAQALALADGSIFHRRQAVANKLIDAVGGEQEAIDWLAAKADGKLKVVEWKSRKSGRGWLLSEDTVRTIGRALGMPDCGGDLLKETIGGDR